MEFAEFSPKSESHSRKQADGMILDCMGGNEKDGFLDNYEESRKEENEGAVGWEPEKEEQKTNGGVPLPDQKEKDSELEEEEEASESGFMEFIEKHERALMEAEDYRSRMVQMHEKNEELLKENDHLKRNQNGNKGKSEESQRALNQIQSKHRKFRGVFAAINGHIPNEADPLQLLGYIEKLQEMLIGQPDIKKSPVKKPQTPKEIPSPKKKQLN